MQLLHGSKSSKVDLPPERGPTIVVLYLPLGGGHKSAAEAISDALRRAEPQLRVQVVDLASALFPRLKLSSTVSAVYALLVRLLGGRLHLAIYRFADRRPEALVKALDMVFGRELLRFITGRSPVAVVSTFSVVSALVAENLATTDIPVVSIVTDAGRVNRIWTVGSPTRILTADFKTEQLWRASGTAVSNCKFVGPVVHQKFIDAPSRSLAKRTLGIDVDRFTVLLNMGLLPPRHRIRRFISELSSISSTIQVLVREDARLNGADDEIIVRKSSSDLQLVGLAAADVVVGKAGWMTLNEAVVVGRGVIIVDAIPGQEEQNADYCVRARGAVALGPAGAARMVSNMAAGDQEESVLPCWSDEAVSAASSGATLAALEIIGLIEERRSCRG